MLIKGSSINKPPEVIDSKNNCIGVITILTPLLKCAVHTITRKHIR